MESVGKAPVMTPVEGGAPRVASFVQVDDDATEVDTLVVHSAGIPSAPVPHVEDGRGVFVEEDNATALGKKDCPPTKGGSQAKAPGHAISYRPDIDGLRTVAVVPVVIFHAYPHLLPGGFVGVDVFFVISGFLISAILFKEGAKGTFTYANFYSRRIRRIYPALLVVVTATLIVGCCWLLKTPLRTLAATLIAGTLFGANIQLLTVEQGYFDDSVKENPLLHLWSLGVEEQFYIVWPFLVSVFLRLPLRRAVLAQVAFIVASFVCNVLLLGVGGTNKYAFYFPFSRFWQMAIGGLLAYDQAHTKTVATFVGAKPAVVSRRPLAKAQNVGLRKVWPSGALELREGGGLRNNSWRVVLRGGTVTPTYKVSETVCGDVMGDPGRVVGSL